MIVNEIAKLVNPLQAAVQLLLVAELGEAFLVASVTGRRRSGRHALSPP